jgi:hypothetical protein
MNSSHCMPIESPGRQEERRTLLINVACRLASSIVARTPYRVICDNLWASILAQYLSHILPTSSQTPNLFASQVEENTFVVRHFINPADGYYGSVRGLVNFANLFPSVDPSWWIRRFCTRPCEHYELRDFSPGEPEALKSLVYIDQVLANLIYLC